MNIYNILAVVLSVLIYIYLINLLRSGHAEQNLATWVSWAMLDIMAGASLYSQKGNWQFLVVYVMGSLIISWFIWSSAKFKWGVVEIICMTLVIACIIVWKIFGPEYATIISIIGVCIATWPQLVEAFETPEKTPVEVYAGFTIVNIFATLAGKDWSIEERLYPMICIVLCAFIVSFASRKYFVDRPPSV